MSYRVIKAFGPRPWRAMAEQAYGLSGTKIGDAWVEDADGKRVATCNVTNHAIAIAAAVNAYGETERELERTRQAHGCSPSCVHRQKEPTND